MSWVLLLEVSSRSVSAHWHAHPALRLAAERRLADSRASLVLRFRSETETMNGGGAGFDVPIPIASGSAILQIDRPYELLRCELGLLHPDGRFAALARSNRIQTPRPGPADRLAETFREVLPPRSPRWERRASSRPIRPAAFLPAEAVVDSSGEERENERTEPRPMRLDELPPGLYPAGLLASLGFLVPPAWEDEAAWAAFELDGAVSLEAAGAGEEGPRSGADARTGAVARSGSAPRASGRPYPLGLLQAGGLHAGVTSPGGAPTSGAGGEAPSSPAQWAPWRDEGLESVSPPRSPRGDGRRA